MSLKRLIFFSYLTTLLFGCLALRIFYLQVLQGVNLFQMAQNQYQKRIKAESYRGKITDRNGDILSDSIESMSVYLHPKEMNRKRETLEFLKERLNLTSLDLNSKKGFVWISRKCNPHLVQDIVDKNLKGLGALSEQKRYYPNGSLACHLIGAVGMDNRGLSGLELSLDSFLAGRPVYLEQMRDGKGRRFLQDPEGNMVSIQSQNSPLQVAVLTIDRKIQFWAEKEIERAVVEMGAVSGNILIQDPKTGEMLVMASYPKFDPNQFVIGTRDSKEDSVADVSHLKNKMISDLFEPGSTFKIVTFSAAIEEGKFKLDNFIDCEHGKWKFGVLKIHDHEPSGVISFPEVLERSSNIGSAKVGLSLQKEEFYKYMRAFGFGSKTGIPLPGEIEGLIRPPREWSTTSLPTIAFGQEVGVTALQLVGAYSAIANGGVLMEPLILKEMREWRDGVHKIKKFYPQKVRQVVSLKTAHLMQQLLLGVVERGTGKLAKVPNYSVAGKTGTAQKFDANTKKYSETKYISSFCGFLPAEDPRLVCLVTIEEPKKDYWGGSVAAPVFARIMKRAAQYLEIPKKNISVITVARVK